MRFRTMHLQALVLGLAASAAVVSTPPAAARESGAESVSARLVSEVASVAPGEPFWVGLRFDIREGWHINWKNPGDAGLAPAVEWRLPPGFSAGPLVWPAPSRYDAGPLVIFGYGGESYLLAQITPPADLVAGGEVRIAGTVDWLACREACVPGQARIALSLPVGADAPEWNQSVHAAFTRVRSTIPRPSPDGIFSASLSRDSLVLTIEPGSNTTGARDVFFFPEAQGLIDNAAEQKWRRVGDAHALTMARDEYATTPPDRLKGVAVIRGPNDRTTAIAVDVPLTQR